MAGYDEEIGIPEVFGLIGEHVTEQYLLTNADSFVRADRFTFLSSSFLSRDHKREFDISDLSFVTDQCQKHTYLCEYEKDKRPCLHSTFFEANYNPSPYLNLSQRGNIKHSWYCALRFTHLAIQRYGDLFTTDPERFLIDYLIAHFFIENARRSKVPPKERFGLTDAGCSWFEKQHERGFPGRLDYFAKRGDTYFCIDSKVNTAKLNLWQQIRMAWMLRCGHKSQIYHVTFQAPDKKLVKDVFLQEGVESAANLVKPTLEILSYDPEKYPNAERFVDNKDTFLAVAKERFGFIPQEGIDYFTQTL